MIISGMIQTGVWTTAFVVALVPTSLKYDAIKNGFLLNLGVICDVCGFLLGTFWMFGMFDQVVDLMANLGKTSKAQKIESSHLYG